MEDLIKSLVSAALFVPLSASPAGAQDQPPPLNQPDRGDTFTLDGDRVIVGAGISVVPRYIGSHSSSVIPMAEVRGQVSGIAFSTDGTSLSVDAVPRKDGMGWKFQAGPMLELRLDRNRFISGTPVEQLGKLKAAWEPGVWASKRLAS